MDVATFATGILCVLGVCCFACKWFENHEANKPKDGERKWWA